MFNDKRCYIYNKAFYEAFLLRKVLQNESFERFDLIRHGLKKEVYMKRQFTYSIC